MTEAPFKVGQRVVCVDDSEQHPIVDRVFKDRVYTVKKISYDADEINFGVFVKSGWYMSLEECFPIYWYLCASFAPITETYEDITAEIAAGLSETAERPDVIRIKEPVKN